MKEHVKVVGVFHICMSASFILIGLSLAFALLGIGRISGDETAFSVLAMIAAVCAGPLTVLSLPGLIAGIGILSYRPWARILLLVVSAFELFNVPLGTALGIYSFWVLTHKDVNRLFWFGENSSFGSTPAEMTA